MKTKCCLWRNQICKDKWLWIIFVVSIWIIIATQCGIWMIPCRMSISTCENINNVSFTIASSYVAGFIFYFLSVTIPYIRNYIVVLKEITELFRAIVDIFRDMSSELCGGDWLENENLKTEAVKELSFNQSNSVDGENKRIEIIEKILADYIGKIDVCFIQLISFYNYMEPRSQELLTEIKTSKSFQRCRMFKNTTEILDEAKSTIIIGELIHYNIQINKEYNRLKNYL